MGAAADSGAAAISLSGNLPVFYAQRTWNFKICAELHASLPTNKQYLLASERYTPIFGPLHPPEALPLDPTSLIGPPLKILDLHWVGLYFALRWKRLKYYVFCMLVSLLYLLACRWWWCRNWWPARGQRWLYFVTDRQTTAGADVSAGQCVWCIHGWTSDHRWWPQGGHETWPAVWDDQPCQHPPRTCTTIDTRPCYHRAALLTSTSVCWVFIMGGQYMRQAGCPTTSQQQYRL